MSNDVIGRGVVELEMRDSGVEAGIAKVDQALASLGPSATKAGAEASAGVAKIGDGAATAADKVDAATTRATKSIHNLGEAGRKAGDGAGGLPKLGAGASEADKKIDAATRNMIASIQRTTAAMEAGSRTGSEYFRVLASQRGVDPAALKPYLAQLDAVTAKQTRAGMSTGELSNAMRTLPAQFTDIATSLAGGQDPLLVFIQQGGQLKDMFGGVGPAAQAMGQYIAGLVNPLTVSVAAVAALTYAYHVGSQEAQDYANALIATNNAAGATAEQMADMAASIDAYYGTQRAAAEAIAALAETGKVSGDNMERFASVSLQWADATGQSVGDVVEYFAALGKDPVEASLKLDESLRFLTVSVLDQIASLVEQGRETEAVSVAQNALADVMAKRTPEMQQNIGFIETSWKGVKNVVLEVLDAMASIGRQQTSVQRLAEIKAQLQSGLSTTTSGRDERQRTLSDAELRALRVEQDALESDMRRAATDATRDAEREARRSKGVKAQQEYNRLLESGATRAEKLAKALQGVDRIAADLAAAGKPLSTAEVAKLKAIEAEKYKEPKRRGRTGSGLSSSDNAMASIAGDIAARKRELEMLTAENTVTAKLTATQEKMLEVEAKLGLAKKESTKASLRQQLAGLKDLDQLERQVAQRKEAIKGAEEERKLDEKRTEAIFAANVAREEEILQLQQQAAEYGLTAAQIADNTARTWELSLAEAEKNGASAESIDYLREQADAYRRLADAQAGLQTNKEFVDKAKKSVADQAKAAADEWQKAADQINQSLTDALMRGFESGRGFGESFAESLEATFKTMILKPAVEFAVNSAMGGMGQLASAAGVPGMGQSSALSAAYGNAAPSLFGINSAAIDAWGAKHLGTANVGQNFVGPLPAGQTAGMTLSGGLGAAGAGMTVGGSIGGMVGQKTGSKEMGALTGAATGAAMGFMYGGGPVGAVIGGVAGGLMGYLGSGGGDEKKAKRNTAIGKVGADGTIRAYDGGNGSDGSNVGAARKMAESFAAVQEQMRVVGDFNKSLGASFGIGSVRNDYFTVGKESFSLSAGDKDGILLKAVQSAARQSESTDSYVRQAVLNIKSSQDLGKLGEILEFAKNYRYQMASMEAARDPRAAQRADLRAEAFASADQRRQALAAQMQQAKESGFDVTRLLAAQRNQVLADMGLVGSSKPLEGVALEMATVTANAEAMRSVLSELGYSVAQQDKLIAESVAAQRAQKRADWMDGVREQLLQITDASKLAEEQLKKDVAARLADAKALGVNAAQLQQVAQLNALEAARVAAEAYRSRTAFGQNLGVRELNLAGKTQQASLSEFDYAARLEVLDAKAAGKSAADIARLEKVLAQERLKVIKDFNQQALDAQKQLATSLKDWLSSQRLGDLSSLSPDAKLAEARRQYDVLYASAAKGDTAAQDKLTAAAESLLEAGKAMYASGKDYVSLESYVTGGIGKLGKALKLPGFARGGLAQGWAIVGEEGPELVNFSNPGRVYTADQTSAALDWSRYGRQDNAALVTEVRALRQEVSQLRTERRLADAEHQQQRGAIAQAELGETKATRRALERSEAAKL